MSSAAQRPEQGYARELVEDFRVAARAERAKLQAKIAYEESRARRARATVGVYRVMVGMLLETQRELAELRGAAETTAAETGRAAEEKAQVLLHAAHEGSHADFDQRGDQRWAPTGSDSVLDLAGLERDEQKSAQPTEAAPPDDQFFAYLRGALADEQPLGPRSE